MNKTICLNQSMPLYLLHKSQRQNTMRRMQRLLPLILCVCAVMALSACVKRVDTRSVMHPTTNDKFLKINSGKQDINIHYLEYPGHGPNVVLIHGFASSTATWEVVISKLQKKYSDAGKPVPHVWAVDIKGCGWSDKPNNAKYDPFTLTEDVYAWMQKVGLDNATVVGNSLGGAIAMIMAVDHPDIVGRLVLVDAGGYQPDKKEFSAFSYVPFSNFWVNLGFNRWMVKKGLRKAFYDCNKITDAMVDASFDRLRTRGAVDAMVSMAKSLDPEQALTYEGRIPDIKQETLIIWGRNDGWIPLKYGYRFNREIKRSELFVIPECGHVPQAEKPDEFVQILYHFLSKTPLPPVGNTGQY